MKRLLILVISSVLLSGCEPFPEDAPASSGDTPTKSVAEAKAPKVNTPSTTETQKQSDAAPVQSTASSTPADAPTSVKTEVQSTSSAGNQPAAKPEEPEPVVEPEDDQPKLAPNAGKLQIIGSVGKQVYYMKKVEQPDANCYVVTNSVTWDTSVSCVAADNVTKKEEKPPVTTVTSGQ